MADEPQELDALEKLLVAHVNKIGEVMNDGVLKTQALCDESLLGVKKRSGLRSQLLDKALKSMGITESTDDPNATQ